MPVNHFLFWKYKCPCKVILHEAKWVRGGVIIKKRENFGLFPLFVTFFNLKASLTNQLYCNCLHKCHFILDILPHPLCFMQYCFAGTLVLSKLDMLDWHNIYIFFPILIFLFVQTQTLPQLNSTLSWVRHENDFANHPPTKYEYRIYS